MDINSLDIDFIEEIANTRDKHKLKLTANKEDITVFRKGNLCKLINKKNNIVVDFIPIGINESLLSEKIDKKIKGNYSQILNELIRQEEDEELSELFHEIVKT